MFSSLVSQQAVIEVSERSNIFAQEISVGKDKRMQIKERNVAFDLILVSLQTSTPT